MNIIVAHNRYAAPGGEDQVFVREVALLEQAGHRVHRFTADNAALVGGFSTAMNAVWNHAAARRMAELVRATGADIVHVHNTFAALSPAIVAAARGAGAAVVVSLHNFRLVCVNANLVRHGRPCHRCLGRGLAWPGMIGRCYRGSAVQSAVVAAIAAFHRLAGTWRDQVDCYMTPSASARAVLVRGGLPAERVVVKPNFAPDRHGGHSLRGPRRGAVMVGRVVAEKGAAVAAAAWRRPDVDLGLTVVGEGDLSGVFADPGLAAKVRCVGQLDQDGVAAVMRDAMVLVAPSLTYETFGLMVVEAFAAGLPAIVSGHGGLAELVEDGRTGLWVRPGDAEDLAAKLRWAAANPEAMAGMGAAARRVYESRFTPAANLPLLLEVYAESIVRRRAALRAGG